MAGFGRFKVLSVITGGRGIYPARWTCDGGVEGIEDGGAGSMAIFGTSAAAL
jgi:hypothetical protein